MKRNTGGKTKFVFKVTVETNIDKDMEQKKEVGKRMVEEQHERILFSMI